MNNVYLFIAILILLYTAIKAKKNFQDTKKWIPIAIFGMAIALTILIYPICNKTSIIGKLVYSIIYSVQTIILNENLEVVDNIQIVQILDAIYVGIIYIISLVMPLLTVSFLVSLIEGFTAKIKLYCIKKSEILIFSETNEKTIAIAKKQYTGRKLIIFANYQSEENKKFNQEIKSVKGIKFHSMVENINFEKLKSNIITIYIANENEQNNLTLTLKLIEKNKLLNKKIKIYSILNNETSRVILDSTDKGNIQLEIVNEIERTILQLLQNKPIYLNAINNEISVLIIGCGKVGKEFLKTITWCGQIIGYKLKINILDIRANKIKEQIKKECPELIDNYDYNFIEADINSTRSLEELEKIKNINYVVVTLQDDETNIKEALFLRQFFLSQDKEHYNNKPIINIWIKNEEKNRQISALKNEKDLSYELNAFGSINEIYYKYPIINSKIEEMSKKVHLVYSPEDKELSEYYKTEYDIKSSRATATHIKYKLYSVLKEKYTGNIEKDIKEFEKLITNKEIFNKLVKNEHNRWNAYMRSDGYKTASIEDVEKYRKFTNNYKHLLAKMHPAIVDFEKLDEIGLKIGKDLKCQDEKIIRNISNIVNVS